MAWNRIIREEDVFIEELTDEHGIVVGSVQKFFDEGPSYAAWADGNRLGAYETHDAAKAAVEAAHG